MNTSLHRFTLANGLTLLVQPDFSTPMVAVNLLYKVGARDEQPQTTGLAHLFEHLMFEGSKHIPSFDTPLQLAGGTNNAFTNNDITNYYCLLPAANIDTALWLESDRMLSLDFSQEKLDIQKKVVIEEFNQRYLNQPYGDIWLESRKLSYKVHPYRWPTIGSTPEHVEKTTLEEIKAFYFSHYAPNNAILSLVGPLDPEACLEKVEHWFGPIPLRNLDKHPYPKEPLQTERRFLEMERDVPLDALWMGWHMPERNHPDYHALDLFTDLCSAGDSGWFNRDLVRKDQIFTAGGWYVSGSHDPGQLIFSGTLRTELNLTEAEAKLKAWVKDILAQPIPLSELEKALRRLKTREAFEQSSVQQRALKLAWFEWISRAEDAFTEIERYQSISPEQLQATVMRYLVDSNCSIIHYKAKRKS